MLCTEVQCPRERRPPVQRSAHNRCCLLCAAVQLAPQRMPPTHARAELASRCVLAASLQYEQQRCHHGDGSPHDCCNGKLDHSSTAGWAAEVETACTAHQHIHVSDVNDTWISVTTLSSLACIHACVRGCVPARCTHVCMQHVTMSTGIHASRRNICLRS
jgi:hypothetical protein